MADFRSTIFSIDEGGAGAISWAPLLSICTTCCQLSILPADLLAALIDRLKSEATYVVLNTLTALHTLCLNSKQPVHDQLVSSKVMKYLERLLNKPPFPGVEMAAAQLLMDWAFLYGQEELGHRSFAALTSTSKHRAMLQSMAASDVAVMLKEDQKLGLPQFCSTRKGLDFQRHFTTQLAGPLTGNATPPGVASQLAKAAVAASYSDSAAAAAAAAASRNTFAAWAERVAQDPQAAAQRVLDSHSSIQADLDALEAAQEACAAAARECAKQQPVHNNSSSSSSSRPQAPEMVQLRHQLDKAYLAACKANEWREMTEVLVQQRLPDTQLSALLSLADKINSVLDGWQQAATTEVFWLLGVNTAGLADGSILRQTVAAATAAAGTGATVGDASAATAVAAAAPAAAAATAAALGASKLEQQQVQQQSPGSLLRGSSSYLDLLTGDTPAAMSTTNPFVNSSSMDRAPVQAYSGNAAAAGATDELQQYLQELGVAPTNSTSSGSFSQSQQQQQQRRSPAPQQPQPHRPAPPPPQQQQRQQQQHFKHYPAIGAPPSQQQGGWLGSAVAPGAGPPPPQQQQPHPAAIHSMDRVSSTSSSSNSGRAAKQAVAATTSAAAAVSSTGAAGAATATVGVAAGDTGSSSDSPAATCSYTNPFASLDTRTIMRGMKGSGSGPVTPSAGLPGVATSSRGSARSSMDGSSSAHSHAPPAHHHHPPQQQQQQQHGRLLVQPQEQEQVPAALAGQGSSPLAMLTPLSPPAAAAAVPQLQLKVQQLFQRLSGGGHPASSCGSCGLPDRSCLEPAVLQLLLEQQHHHELQLQHMQHQHQTQVAEIKAMAVQRFKELQQQLAAHKQ